MIRGVDHVGLTVPDLEEAVDVPTRCLRLRGGPSNWCPFAAEDDWMTRRLGVRRDARIPQIAVLACGDGARLEVFEYDVPDQRREGPRNSDVGGHHVAFYADDLEAAVRRAEAAGGTIMDQPTVMAEGPSAGETWVYVRAPWGAQFELVTRDARYRDG